MKMGEVFKPEFNNPFHWGWLAEISGEPREISEKGKTYPKACQEAWLSGWDTANETGFGKYLALSEVIREENKKRIEECIKETQFFNQTGRSRMQYSDDEWG